MFRGKNRDVGIRMQLNEERAKKIIERLYSNPKNWRKKEFRKAYFTLTGQKEVMSEKAARETLKLLVRDQNRRERVEYVSALLLITGKWILPRPIASSGMSNQIKANYNHGDMRSCFHPFPYKK